MSDDVPVATTLRLARCRADDPGHLLGLRSGDVLIGLDGRAWSGTPGTLAARKPGRSVLTFRRGEAVWSVITDRLDLGQWDAGAPPSPSLPFKSFDADLLWNWEIIADQHGLHDLFPLRPSLTALVMPALWLTHRRLWTLLATLIAGLAVSLPAGLPAVIGLWLAAGLHLWRSGTDHIRADRAAAAFHRVGIVAAATETEAIAAWVRLSPNARFLYGASRPDLTLGTAS